MTISFEGRLTHDPELRFTGNGHAVVSFNVAENDRRFNQETKTWEDGQATFWRCVAWRTMAENIAETCTKGTPVVITGRTKTRAWQTAEGEDRTSLEVEVDAVGLSLRYDPARSLNNSGAKRNDATPADPFEAANASPF